MRVVSLFRAAGRNNDTGERTRSMRLYLFQLALHPANDIPAPGYLIQTDGVIDRCGCWWIPAQLIRKQQVAG